MGPILERTIHARTQGIDLDLRFESPLCGETWGQIQTEVRTHRSQPVPGTLGPIEVDGQGRGLRFSFPRFDVRTTRLDSVLSGVRGQPALVAALLARARVLGQRLIDAGRSPDVGEPGALLVHPEGRVALLGVGTPLLRAILVGETSQETELEAQLQRLASALGAGSLPPPPNAAAFGRAWQQLVGQVGLQGPDVLRGPARRPASSPATGPAGHASSPATGPAGHASSPATGPAGHASSPATGPAGQASPPASGPSLAAPSAPPSPAKSPVSARPGAPTPAPPLRLPPLDAPAPAPAPSSSPSPSPGPSLDGEGLAALAAASPEAQMAALRASEPPLRAPPQGVWIALALLLIGAAGVILVRTHAGVNGAPQELAPPVPRPLRGPGYQPPPPSAIGRPPGAVPKARIDGSPASPGSPTRAQRAAEGPQLVSVVSKPSGATVRLEGEIVGKTPLVQRRALEDRSYELRIDMPGYRPWSKRLRPDPNTGALSALVELQPR